MALAFASAAGAAERPTLADLEDEVMCPECGTTLDMSDAPVADSLRAYIQRRIDAGDSEAEIKDRLVEQFGEEVLASPPKRGFSLLAWAVPAGGILLAAGLLAYLAWRWSVRRDHAGEPYDDDDDRELGLRLDDLIASADD